MQEMATVTAEKFDDQTAPKRISSEAIFGAERQILIEHGKSEYLLRITRYGKLILTK